MTLGERLQQLRKEKQMSQEELGKLLFVSRQTVSLWENNQTVPTVENLIRLKEIFGVSIDSILTYEESEISESDNNEQFLERHCFSLEKSEMKYIYKIFTLPLLKKLVIWIFLLFFSIFVTFSDTSEEQNSYFVFFLAFIFFCINLARYIYGFYATKKNAERVCNRKYIYEVQRDYIIAKVLNADDEIKTQKIYLAEVEKCWETPFCYFLEIKDRNSFIIKKSVLGENSYLASFCKNLKSDKTDLSSKKVVLLKTVASVLFVGCFISLFTAITISLDMASENAETIYDSMEAFKYFHYFLPVPLLSVVVGIILNKNKIRNKRNIILGVLIGLIMLIYGLFPTFFGNVGDRLDAIEAQLGFEFPQTAGMNYHQTAEISGGKQTIIALSFAETVANDFETFMENDRRWEKGDNEAFSKIIPEDAANFPADYYLIYNADTDEFGKKPEKDGQYQFIYIAYSTEMNVAYVYDYQCNVE